MKICNIIFPMENIWSQLTNVSIAKFELANKFLNVSYILIQVINRFFLWLMDLKN